jgi:hypothetical protein
MTDIIEAIAEIARLRTEAADRAGARDIGRGSR